MAPDKDVQWILIDFEGHEGGKLQATWSQNSVKNQASEKKY